MCGGTSFAFEWNKEVLDWKFSFWTSMQSITRGNLVRTKSTFSIKYKTTELIVTIKVSRWLSSLKYNIQYLYLSIYKQAESSKTALLKRSSPFVTRDTLYSQRTGTKWSWRNLEGRRRKAKFLAMGKAHKSQAYRPFSPGVGTDVCRTNVLERIGSCSSSFIYHLLNCGCAFCFCLFCF